MSIKSQTPKLMTKYRGEMGGGGGGEEIKKVLLKLFSSKHFGLLGALLAQWWSSIAHSLSLSFKHRPDMTEILLKRT